MPGWSSHYVRETAELVETFRLDARSRVITVKGAGVSCGHFLPYCGDAEPSKPVKARHKRKVFFHQVGEEGFYLKKYSYRFTRRHCARLRGFIWTMPIAQRQLHKMLFLKERGAGVAEPVMAFVRRYGMVKQESMLVMRECRGLLLKRFLEEVDDFERRLRVMAQTFRFLSLLHAHGIHHGDMARHNFIVTPGDKLVAFDLDERKTKWLGPIGNRKELKKWTRMSAAIMGIAGDGAPSPQSRAFERMLEENCPAARRYFRAQAPENAPGR